MVGMRSRVFVIVGAVWLASCQRQPAFDPEDPSAVAAIDSEMESMIAGADSADADRVTQMLQKSGDVTFITGDVMLRGFDTIRAQFQDTYKGVSHQDHTVADEEVRLLSPDVALVTVLGEGTYTDEAGWTSDPVGIGLTVVFVRQDGSWRAQHVHQSIVESIEK